MWGYGSIKKQYEIKRKAEKIYADFLILGFPAGSGQCGGVSAQYPGGAGGELLCPFVLRGGGLFTDLQ